MAVIEVEKIYIPMAYMDMGLVHKRAD